MHSKSPVLALSAIVTNIVLARQFVNGMSFDEFRADQKTLYAVIRCLEIISEASRKLPPDLKLRHDHIPWAQIASAGNIYRYEYKDVREKIIWQTVHAALGPLETVVADELALSREQGL